MDFQADIVTYLDRVRAGLDLLDHDQLNSFALAMVRALEEDRDIYIFGNGGSAAAASHFAVDIGKGASLGASKRFRIHCLTDNVPTLTALANDLSYADVFVEPLRSLLRPGDLVIALSGSGNSPNVIRAVEYAKERGAQVVGICGFDGGRLRELADIPVHLPMNDMQVSEDMQTVITHVIMRTMAKHQGVKGC